MNFKMTSFKAPLTQQHLMSTYLSIRHLIPSNHPANLLTDILSAQPPAQRTGPHVSWGVTSMCPSRWWYLKKKESSIWKYLQYFLFFFSLSWKKLKLCVIIVPKTQNTNRINETSVGLMELLAFLYTVLGNWWGWVAQTGEYSICRLKLYCTLINRAPFFS